MEDAAAVAAASTSTAGTFARTRRTPDASIAGTSYRRGSFNTDNTYKATLQRVDGRFGFTYRAVDETSGLMVTAIYPGSGVDVWNETSDVDKVICVGDWIKAVNHRTNDGKAMVEELLSAEAVTLLLHKSGPRWHVLGSTAECMDKLADAREHGVTLKPLRTVALDEAIHERALPPISAAQFLMIAFAAALPNVVTVSLFSSMGKGIEVFNLLSPLSMNTYGTGIAFCATVFVVSLYIVDWMQWKNSVQRVVTALIAVYAFAIAGIMKAMYYPAFPLVICLFHIPIFLGILRGTSLKTVQRSSFYKSAAACAFAVGLGILLAWLCWMNIRAWDGINQYNDDTKMDLVLQSKAMYDNQEITVNGRTRSIVYSWDCIEGEPNPYDFDVDARGNFVQSEHLLDAIEADKRAKACGRVKTVWFLCWMAPFVATACNLIIAAFCLMNGVWLNISDTTKVEKALRHFVLMIFVMLLMMWVSVSIAGASMRLTSALLSFSAAGLLVLFIWVYLEIGEKALATALQNSQIVVSLITLVTSDWCRAIFVICLNVLIPAMFVIEMMKQKMRKLRQTNTTDGRLTEEAYKAMQSLMQWRWINIFIKANWLILLYWTVFIGAGKITVVFLSWLNEQLELWDFGWVLFVFFWIGFTMFMLPPVPGIPVYVTSGIIVAKQGNDIVGFWGGTVIAIFLSFTLKLVASTGQYMIGYFMGKSLKVQQLVGVDKVFTRGIESILQVRGLSMGKVAVLVGGPDWPTSVLCGILGLSIPQVVLGTTPVIFVSTPCVLAGAFMAGPGGDLSDSERGLWSALANTALGVSALVQLTSGMLALYYIQDVIHKSSEELSQPRPEHAAVQALTLSEKEYNQVYAEVTDWRMIPRLWMGVALFSTSVMLCSCFVLTFMDEVCFKPFEVRYRVSDRESENGLGESSFIGALQSLVKIGGDLAIAAFFCGAVCHFVFLKWAGVQAQRLLLKKQAMLVDGGEQEALRQASVNESRRPSVDERPLRACL